MGGKVCLRRKGKKMLGIVNKILVFKIFLTTSSNTNFAFTLFSPIIWIFAESEGDGIKSRLPFKIFYTIKFQVSMFKRHKLWVFSFCAKNNQFSQTITQSFIRKSPFFRQIVNVMCLRSFAKQKTSHFRGYFEAASLSWLLCFAFLGYAVHPFCVSA